MQRRQRLRSFAAGASLALFMARAHAEAPASTPAGPWFDAGGSARQAGPQSPIAEPPCDPPLRVHTRALDGLRATTGPTGPGRDRGRERGAPEGAPGSVP